MAFQHFHSSRTMGELPCSDARGSLLSATHTTWKHTHKSEVDRDDILQIEPYNILYISPTSTNFDPWNYAKLWLGTRSPVLYFVGDRPAGTFSCIWTVPNDLECHSRSTTCDEACRRVGLNGLPLQIPNLWVSARGKERQGNRFT